VQDRTIVTIERKYPVGTPVSCDMIRGFNVDWRPECGQPNLNPGKDWYNGVHT